jgi:ADP-ribose pyrophosphatase YjhB (NUDIX family)
MKLLKEISEKSLGISNAEILEENYKFRKSARAILLNDKNEVSIQYVGKWDYYKLPGGGVEIGETEKEALKRDIMEEVGCDIMIENELGVIIEWRNSEDLLHLSYGYLCRVKGDIGKPSYEQGEIDDEYKPIWKPLEESIKLMKDHYPDEPYNAKFIVTREKRFLEEAKNFLDNR